MKKALSILILFVLTINSFAQNWTDPVNISNMDGTDNQPDITVDHNGKYHCVWAHKIEENYWKIYYSKSLDGGLTWFTPEDISLNDEKWLSSPHIVADSENNLHVTYDFNVGNPYETLVYYKMFDGTNWSEPFVVSENMPESHANKLVIDNNDRVYCVWFRILYNETTFYRYLENDVWSDIFIPYDNNDYFTFLSCSIDSSNNLHWIGAHHYEGQTAYYIKPVYFFYDYEDDLWSDFIEFGENNSGNGFDIDLDNSENPHLVWQAFTNDSIPPNDGTFYVYNNGINWTVPELIVEDPRNQQIVIDENNQPNIFDVEKTENGSMLVHYYKVQDNWNGLIVDESDYNTMHLKIHNHNYKLLAVYIKPTVNDIGEIFFSKSNIISSLPNYQKQNLKINIYPNPFKHYIKISFEINNTKRTTIKVYTIQGKLIITLINENKSPGKYEIIWNGKDKNGKEVTSGLYLVRLQSGRIILTRSVEYLK